MKVQDLIEALREMPADANVYAFDRVTDADEQVTGLELEFRSDGSKAVVICTHCD